MDQQQILLDMSRTLGGLVEKLDGLTRELGESREESNTGRRRLYLRLEASEAKTEADSAAVLERLARLERLAAETAAKVAKIEPMMEAFTRLRQRGIGAIAVVGFVATLIGGAIALKLDAVVALFGRWFGPGP